MDNQFNQPGGVPPMGYAGGFVPQGNPGEQPAVPYGAQGNPYAAPANP